MKLPRLITRRRVKWAGTTLAVLLCVVFALSGKGYAQVLWSSDDGAFHTIPSSAQHITLLHGQLWLSRRTSGDGFADEGSVRWRLEEYSSYRIAWGWEFEWWPSATSSYHSVKIPLWFLLLLIAAPTAWLWHTDRRAKPWQCPKCRYDLRGLDGGVCPECGAD